MRLNHMSDSAFDFSFIKEPRRERKIERGRRKKTAKRG